MFRDRGSNHLVTEEEQRFNTPRSTKRSNIKSDGTDIERGDTGKFNQTQYILTFSDDGNTISNPGLLYLLLF